MRVAATFWALLGVVFLTHCVHADEPKTAEEYIKRGTERHDKGKHDEALADYTKAIELNPKSSRGYASRGAAYGHQKKYTEAITDLTKAIELDLIDTVSYLNRGLAYHNMGKSAEAISDGCRCPDPRVYAAIAGVLVSRGR